MPPEPAPAERRPDPFAALGAPEWLSAAAAHVFASGLRFLEFALGFAALGNYWCALDVLAESPIIARVAAGLTAELHRTPLHLALLRAPRSLEVARALLGRRAPVGRRAPHVARLMAAAMNGMPMYVRAR